MSGKDKEKEKELVDDIDKHSSISEENMFDPTWTREQEKILAEWCEKGRCYFWLHTEAERVFRRGHHRFSIPVIILSTLTGTANFAINSVPEEHKETAQLTIGAVNIFAGVISTLQSFLRYAENMESHRVSAQSWSKLERNIQVELVQDPSRRTNAHDVMKITKAEYDRLIEQSPLIPPKILATFENKFKKHPNIDKINKPEVCDGLDLCKVYERTSEDKVSDIVANAGNIFKRKATLKILPTEHDIDLEDPKSKPKIKIEMAELDPSKP
jgi:hypothetical protein